MNKIIIIVTLIVVGIIGLMIWGKSAQNTVEADTGAISNLTYSEKLYDFGTISMKNGLVTKDFTVTNNTDKDIVIPSLVTSCMCTKAYFVKPDGSIKGPFGMPSMGFVPPLNETIKVGESRVVRAVYDPNAHGPAGVGPIDRFLILTDAAGGKLQLEIKAMVTP
ncbi:MAG: hypothetical protein UT61_C0011G0018 [Candidatus Woesebacteria bacterium GW2011_GWA1_39_8]|uniref:DUF1573 domain-containing protein n=1 Tax=Candidatus Woesebacteria bacterium GW2011_GWA1_39_8 TaxID=1618552 RepID=A0A0G0S648_9BACT|nr:MAG: hypothetical protein US98_C0025G0010 [Parcubacteria group bacterium GW2011_GWC1_38_6]KKR30195.1 MAG: hypothetical protein UT61_C0011G0018 [Candidatus Woesebacteria bacterium GW2011_GWA1_39_8]